ncbi:CU044_5270 family protein [Streptomyces sp. NPDC018031]|uniref:CU044_5270 family protein n=1 Tax=Streptomyces sp. NPDC018031 TaxID=3365033 RepID=UPI0037A7E17A
MQRDLMRRLAAARPHHLDPGRPAGDEARAGRPAPAVRPPATAAPGPGHRPAPRRPRLRRPGWAGALATAAAVTAVIVATAPGAGTGGAEPADGGSAVLLSAATSVERGPGASGRYWYQERRSGSIRHVPGRDYDLDVRHTTRVWVAKQTSRRWLEYRDIGARPATAEDARAWRADGSPTSWRLTAPGAPDGAAAEVVTHRGAGVLERDAPGGGADTVPMVEFGLAELPGLPTEPGELRAALFGIIDGKYNAPRGVLDGMVATAAEHLAVELPASPELRAAAYRLLATEPGVRDIGAVTDREGRAGNAVAIDDPAGGERRLIFDRRTGLPLGTEHFAADGRPESYTSVIATAWTGQAPPFDEDWSAPRREPPAAEGKVGPARR